MKKSNYKKNESYNRRMHPKHPVHPMIPRHHRELERFHSQIRLLRPFAVIFNVLFLAILVYFTGVNTLVVLFAIVFILREFMQILFMIRLQHRVIEPVKELKEGIEAVAEGNFDIEVETNIDNEFMDLSKAFNGMTDELRHMAQVKEEYENNRKNLLANITHDIKTPLSSIQGYMETINEGAVTDPETLKKYNEIILNNVVYTNKLIDDLFLFSKLDMDKVEFEFLDVNAKGFFADMMEEMAFEVKELGYEWTYLDKLDSDIKIKVDGKRIYQSIRNIVGNAIKYSPGEGLKIQASCKIDNKFLMISIQDNGPGIEKEHLEHIFNRFYRIDKARTKDTMSTGLGLAITKEFVEVHNGTIEIKSQLNVGTTVTLSLPIGEV